jgi:membrane protease subunit HflK
MTDDVRDPLEWEDFVRILKARFAWAAHVPGLGTNTVVTLAVMAVAAWILSGIYKVQPDEQGVVLRFGQRIATTGPGLHYRLPSPIDSVLFPKVTAVNQVKLGVSIAPGEQPSAAAIAADSREHQMLTSDENIVEVDCVIFWQIKDAGDYLFHASQPEAMVKLAAESALRSIIGQTTIQAALSDKRRQIADQTRDLVQRWLDADHTGIEVTQVQLQRIDPPSAVVDAFNDVQRARADQERARNEAESYANDILPRARGEAQRIIQDADAYKAQVTNLAQGEAQSFDALYQSYAGAKDVTAWRLYLESVDAMLKKASKVIVDSSGQGITSLVPTLSINEPKSLEAVPGVKPSTGAPAAALAPAPRTIP